MNRLYIAKQNNKVLYFFLGLVLLLGQNIYAQDPFYTQDFATPVYQNPALAGSKEVVRIALDTRLQWITPFYNLMVNSFSADMAFGKTGVGITSTYDRAGKIFSHTDIGGALSYRFGKLNKIIVVPGIQLSYINYSLNWDDLVFYDQLSSGEGQISEQTAAIMDFENISLIDVNLGIATQFPIRVRRTEPLWFNAGFAAHHLRKNEISFLDISTDNLYPHKYTANAGLLIPIYKKTETCERNVSNLMLYPAIQYTLLGNLSAIDLSTTAYVRPFSFGLGYRTFNEFYSFKNTNQVLGQLGFEGLWREFMTYNISYSLDWAVSGAHSKDFSHLMTHEISLILLISPPRKKNCISALNYKGRWFDNTKDRKERHQDEVRWYDSEKLQHRFVGECPPTKKPQKVGPAMLPSFYPFELPVR